MERFVQDVRYSARLLRKWPGYTAVVVLTLALGISAVTSVLSLMNAVLLRPYSLVDTDRWVYVWEHREKSQSLNQISVSAPNFRDWKENSTGVFADMVVWLPWSYTASGPGIANPERIRAEVITPDVFSTVTAPPAVGRLLTAEDAKSGERRVLLSYEFWKTAYGADPALVGKTIRLNGVTHLVVGVAPPGFAFPPEDQVDAWTTLPTAALTSTDRAGRAYRVAAKLRPGMTPQMAQAALNVIAARLSERYPEDRDYGAIVVPMREAVAGDFRTPLLALSGAVGFALILLCLNVGYLRVVHLAARRKEIALRVALGAGEGVLLRQLLIETLLLFGIGGALGILLAPVGLRLLLSYVPPQEIPWLHVRIDGTALAGAIALTAIAALLSGLVPVVRTLRSELARNLSVGGAVSGSAGVRGRLRSVMIAAQIALALIPLCGAGLLMRSFVRLQEVAPGFDSAHRLSLALYAPKARYPGPAEITALAKEIQKKTQDIPGLKQEGLAQAIPFAPGSRWLQAVSRSNPKGMESFSSLPLVRYSVITPGYFEAMGIPLIAGRLVADFDARDKQPVVVINEKLARLYFPGEDPVGKALWVGHAESLAESVPRIVVGVVGNTHMYALERDPDAAAWVPMAQQTVSEDIWRSLFFVANTERDANGALSDVRQRIQGIDPELATADVSLMTERLRDSLWRQRLSSSVVGAFSLAALGIAVLGVFGVTSYLVALRSREIGIRMAIGAKPGDIWKMVVAQNMVLVAIGIAFGLAGAVALTRLLQGLLFDVRPNDPLTLVMVAGALALAALAASLIPARRAAKVDPLVALRTE
ncbi:MAG TPA: ABC transporter permease [Candidatus Acidoferrales bacterium]|nr:ABC transporter permease [Candidatus Acidoferrales bacterium]